MALIDSGFAPPMEIGVLAEDPYSCSDLHGLSAYQNIQGTMRADFVDTRASLG